MRIISGRFRGLRLPSPKGREIRPTTDRVREALFSSLGPMIVDARVLDLFAGTGAFGLEALSRGAAAVTFVDTDREALRALKKIVDSSGITNRVSILGVGALEAIARLVRERQRFDVVFLDPPYRTDWTSKVLSASGFFDLIESRGLLVVEHDANALEPALPEDFNRRFSRKYGGTRVEIYQRQSLNVRDQQ